VTGLNITGIAGQARRDIILWLRNVDTSPNYDRSREKCHPGTGEWFLGGDTFKKVLEEAGQCVWLYGSREYDILEKLYILAFFTTAGAGKTILA